jgi:chemotaxis protein MotA
LEILPLAKRQIDRGVIAGVLLAVLGIGAGLLLEGGRLTQILQPTAALIVLGGTLGAVLIQFPLRTVQEAAAQLREVLFERSLCSDHTDELVEWCAHARRHGVLAIDAHLEHIENAFLRKCLTCAVDGVAMRAMRETMEIDLDLYEEREEELVKVLEAAGGFAPTLGIIGAVLGLIQVMQRMENVSEIGKGIAVAFVSTLYGIGFANLFLLPMAGKLRIRLRERQLMREMTLEAVIAIAEGISARALRRKLQTYQVEGRLRANPKW